MQQIVKKKSGFTMVEISLAMVFISSLSVIIVLIIVNAVSSYRRGITLNQINTTGMDLVDDMKAAIQASPGRSLKLECSELYSGTAATNCASNNGQSLTLIKRNGNAWMGKDKIQVKDVPIYGAFCTGKYSYVWNSGYFFGDEMGVNGAGSLSVKYNVSGGSGVEKITGRLLKFQDDDRMICKRAAGYTPGSNGGGAYNTDIKSSEIDITNIVLKEEPEDILQGDKFSNLALYDLSAAVPANSGTTNIMFYSMSFVLGTLQGGPNIKAVGNNCTSSETQNAGLENFDYCAINKFNFAAQAIGG